MRRTPAHAATKGLESNWAELAATAKWWGANKLTSRLVSSIHHFWGQGFSCSSLKCEIRHRAQGGSNTRSFRESGLSELAAIVLEITYPSLTASATCFCLCRSFCRAVRLCRKVPAVPPSAARNHRRSQNAPPRLLVASPPWNKAHQCYLQLYDHALKLSWCMPGDVVSEKEGGRAVGSVVTWPLHNGK